MTKSQSHLLIITHECIGERLAGPGIRAWEMGLALSKRHFGVTIASPHITNREHANIQLEQFHWDRSEELLNHIELADAIIATGPVLARVVHMLGKPIDKPTVVDLYDLAEIEQMLSHMPLGTGSPDPSEAYALEMQTYLLSGDFFLCASQRQLDYWLGALMAIGRINLVNLEHDPTLQHLVALVPFGLPDEAPTKSEPVLRGRIPGISSKDKIILWGGGIWEWTDPFLIIESLKKALHVREDLRLVFGSLHHFDQEIVPHTNTARRLWNVCEREGLIDHYVFFLDWFPYEKRGAYLLEADLGVSMHLPSVENRFAVRARYMDYLWANLPCIITGRDYLAEQLADCGLAKIVDPSSPSDKVATIMLQLLEDAEIRQSSRERCQGLRDRYAWPQVILPMIKFLEDPHLAMDAIAAREKAASLQPMQREWDGLRERNAALADEIAMLRNRRVVRIVDKLGAAWKRLGL